VLHAQFDEDHVATCHETWFEDLWEMDQHPINFAGRPSTLSHLCVVCGFYCARIKCNARLVVLARACSTATWHANCRGTFCAKEVYVLRRRFNEQTF
jgi:hypothetical protein